MYILQTNVAKGVYLGVKSSVVDAERKHARFGHIGYDTMHQLSHRDMVTRLPEIEDRRTCDTCIFTKRRRAPFLTKAKFKATTTTLDLVHGDLCGSIMPTTPGGRRFFLLLVDDATRYMWIKLLPTKSDIAVSIKEIKATTRVEVGRTLRVAH
jgi:hypothetical protein